MAFVSFDVVCVVPRNSWFRGFVVVGAYIGKCNWWSLLTKL